MEYKILVNGRPIKADCHVYSFNYGKVKDIRLTISEGKLSIELQMKAKKRADEIFTERNNCFSEALKKGMLFHLILYPKPLPTNNIRIFIDNGEATDWNPEKSPVIYSLISEGLKRRMPDEWKSADAVFEYFLKNHKTDQDSLAASLYAFLYSKAKDSETERFQYLWMSMNGLYTHLAALKCSDRKPPDNNPPSEREKIQVLEEAEGWGTGYVTSTSNPKKNEKESHLAEMAHMIEDVLKEPNFERSDIEELIWNEFILKSFKPNNSDNETDQKINLEGYLNLWYPYYLRCKIFHANKPVPLFSLAKEVEIRRLKFVNDRLESYLDHNLWKYFDEEYCEQKIPKASADTQ